MQCVPSPGFDMVYLKGGAQAQAFGRKINEVGKQLQGAGPVLYFLLVLETETLTSFLVYFQNVQLSTTNLR